MKSYEDHYYGCVDDKGRTLKGYEERIKELLSRFPLGEPIIGDQNKKDFIVLFGNIFRLRNILSAFDKLEGNEILSPIDFQDYTGNYHDIYQEIKPREADIQELIQGEKLKPEETKKLMENAFRDGVLKTTGTDVDKILPPVSRFDSGGS